MPQSCDAARRPQRGEFARQAVRPAGDRTRTEAYDQIARLRQLSNNEDEFARVRQRAGVTMTVLDQTSDESVPAHAFDWRLPCRVDVGDQHNVGVIETGAEVIKEVRKAREAVRLDDGDHLAVGDGAGGLEHRRDFHRMVTIIVDYGDPIPLASFSKPALDAFEIAQRGP